MFYTMMFHEKKKRSEKVDDDSTLSIATVYPYNINVLNNNLFQQQSTGCFIFANLFVNGFWEELFYWLCSFYDTPSPNQYKSII